VRASASTVIFHAASLCAISPRAFLEPDDQPECCQKARIPGGAIRSVPRKTHMDTTTLLVIVLLILLLGGGGWYGRGRWY
jgi:hypothetical protein